MDGFDNNNHLNNNYGNNQNYQQSNNPHDINTTLLQTTSKWAGFLGVINIISGALTCLGAIGTFGLSLVPGIITIILGLKLNKVKSSIENYLRGDSKSINDTFENIGTYFKIQGILMIVGFVLGILGIVVMLVVGFTAFSGFGHMY